MKTLAQSPHRAADAALRGAKTRVRGLGKLLALLVVAGALPSYGSQQRFSDFDEECASEMEVFENWNRFYDPDIGRYYAIDPWAVDDSDYTEALAYEGDALSVYAFALNNPLRYYDEDGNQIVVPIPWVGPVPLPTLPPPPAPWLLPLLWPSPIAPETGLMGKDLEEFTRANENSVCSEGGDGVQEHRKNKRPSNWDKHTKKRAGGKEKKDQRMPYQGKNGKKKK